MPVGGRAGSQLAWAAEWRRPEGFGPACRRFGPKRRHAADAAPGRGERGGPGEAWRHRHSAAAGAIFSSPGRDRRGQTGRAPAARSPDLAPFNLSSLILGSPGQVGPTPTPTPTHTCLTLARGPGPGRDRQAPAEQTGCYERGCHRQPADARGGEPKHSGALRLGAWTAPPGLFRLFAVRQHRLRA